MDRGSLEPSTSLAEAVVPLLDGGARVERSSSGGRSSRGRTREAARYLRRAGSSRFMREQSMVVRETAAEQLEERQSDWAYSRPVVVLDLIWNLAFVSVAAVVLLLSREERPSAPLRMWVLGYTGQCIVHMICVWSEYRRRRGQAARRGSAARRGEGGSGSASGNRRRRSEGAETDEETEAEEAEQPDGRPSVAKRLESVNTMFSFVWWIVGFWCILTGIDDGFQDAPLLSWLCAVFLAFDVFFVVFCVALACVIGIAVCCCLPCIIAILYAVADQEGASEEDIKALPRYKFRQVAGDAVEASMDDDGKLVKRGGVMSLVGASKEQPVERPLSAEDAECCICLCAYDDGTELRELPCLHHFHCVCIDKWLRTKPTCPLCKYDIVHGREASSSPANGEAGSAAGEGEEAV